MTKQELAHIARLMYDLQEYCAFNFWKTEKQCKECAAKKMGYAIYLSLAMVSRKCGELPKSGGKAPGFSRGDESHDDEVCFITKE